ncbi:hypothetical protein CPB83DRAFT_690853 [Crepidotus variabilis]|uniref:Uncharacterized protein n=1 Tax=Crepidotus variabilis TaxID=179855 RepID=A0A9P6JK05_9AGAR|nr:hypothetical protein CPB83DRAFT_690853 [Crepidotus variabilis]
MYQQFHPRNLAFRHSLEAIRDSFQPIRYYFIVVWLNNFHHSFTFLGRPSQVK